MAEFPSYVQIITNGSSETFDPDVDRTEMERGPPKQAVRNSKVMQKVRASLLFRSQAQVADFESWYFGVINRIGYFNLRHPRTGQIISARFEGGSIGTLTPIVSGYRLASREVVFEYLR